MRQSESHVRRLRLLLHGLTLSTGRTPPPPALDDIHVAMVHALYSNMFSVMCIVWHGGWAVDPSRNLHLLSLPGSRVPLRGRLCHSGGGQ
jgi:hypothetical protein